MRLEQGAVAFRQQIRLISNGIKQPPLQAKDKFMAGVHHRLRTTAPFRLQRHHQGLDGALGYARAQIRQGAVCKDGLEFENIMRGGNTRY